MPDIRSFFGGEKVEEGAAASQEKPEAKDAVRLLRPQSSPRQPKDELKKHGLLSTVNGHVAGIITHVLYIVPSSKSFLPVL